MIRCLSNRQWVFSLCQSYSFIFSFIFIFSLNFSFLSLLGSPSGHAMGSSCVWYVMVTAALSYTVRWKDKSAVTLHRSASLCYCNSFWCLFACYVFNGLILTTYSVSFIQFVKTSKQTNKKKLYYDLLQLKSNNIKICAFLYVGVY